MTLKKSENNGTEEIGLVTPTPDDIHLNVFKFAVDVFSYKP